MKLTTPTLRNRSFERLTALAKRIARILKWTDLQWSEHQYEQGHAYLVAYVEADTRIVSAMERSRVFWSWWKNHWGNRDEGYLEFVENTTYDLTALREIYVDMHNAEVLVKSIYPNGSILQESYALMMDDLIKDELQKK